jgi:polyhydroxyalkanoate synthase
LDPESIARELLEFNARLARGLGTLAQLGDVQAGISPRTEVYREDKVVLYRYQPQSAQPLPVPVLICYALVNRPYMADLADGRSLIQGLLQSGLDVYLVDWGYPEACDRFLTLDDYINGYLHRCVDEICRHHGLDALNLLGICQGGAFSLCYTALHPSRVRNLITTVTPVDFHTPRDTLSRLVRGVDVDLLVRAYDNVPGALLNWLFMTLKPFRLMGQKYVALTDSLDDAGRTRDFLRMEKWIFDSPDQAGAAFREFVRDFYQRNGLVRGTVALGGRAVDLTAVTVPVLNVYARDDHLVPPDASKALGGCVGSADYTELEFPGGHIGIYVSARAREMLPPAIAAWLADRC